MDENAKPRLLSVIGARPEIIQAAPVSAALADHVDEVLVHTGQHYDPEMSGLQIADLRLPVPDHNLGVGSLPDAEQVDATTRGLTDLIAQVRPHGVLVRGDTNATLAGARAAKSFALPLFHVEAGLRSFRPDMPEERNRVETDRLSDVLFAPGEGARRRLHAEGIRGTVHVTGDPLADVLFSTRARLPEADEAEPYVLATVHRNYNTDDPERLRAVMSCLGAASSAGDPPAAPAHQRRARARRIDSSPRTSSCASRSPTAACSRSNATRWRSPPTRAACSARPICGVFRASRCARKPSGSRPSRPGGTRSSAPTPTPSAPPSSASAPRCARRSSVTAVRLQRIAALTASHLSRPLPFRHEEVSVA